MKVIVSLIFFSNHLIYATNIFEEDYVEIQGARYNRNANYYDILGITPGDSDIEAKANKNFKWMSLVFHPDKAPTGQKERYESIYQKISEAKDILSNKDFRESYDKDVTNKTARASHHFSRMNKDLYDKARKVGRQEVNKDKLKGYFIDDTKRYEDSIAKEEKLLAEIRNRKNQLKKQIEELTKQSAQKEQDLISRVDKSIQGKLEQIKTILPSEDFCDFDYPAALSREEEWRKEIKSIQLDGSNAIKEQGERMDKNISDAQFKANQKRNAFNPERRKKYELEVADYQKEKENLLAKMGRNCKSKQAKVRDKIKKSEKDRERFDAYKEAKRKIAPIEREIENLQISKEDQLDRLKKEKKASVLKAKEECQKALKEPEKELKKLVKEIAAIEQSAK